MRKSLLVAAALSVASASVFAEGAHASTASPSNQFTVNAPTSNNVVFQGSGTATFNTSQGTNNSFQVGSSTNLGVNASSSSTAEYGVAAIATLDMGDASVMTQVIGTSGASNSTASTASAAHDVARKSMASHDLGVKWESGRTYGSGASAKTYSNAAAWKVDYDREYSTEYGKAVTNIKNSESLTGTEGTISGKFKTQETGSGTSNGSMSDWSANASAAATKEYGRNYENRSGTYSSSSKADWQAAYDAEYNRAYGATAAGANRTSDSEVTVNGIGSDASVTAATTSKFDVKITQNTGQTYGSTATANGSAGASLATSSFANQSQASTASGFMQAFGGT